MGTCTSPLKSKLRRKPSLCPSRYKFREISQTILRLLARLKDLLTDKTTKDEDKGASYDETLCLFFMYYSYGFPKHVFGGALTKGICLVSK